MQDTACCLLAIACLARPVLRLELLTYQVGTGLVAPERAEGQLAQAESVGLLVTDLHMVESGAGVLAAPDQSRRGIAGHRAPEHERLILVCLHQTRACLVGDDLWWNYRCSEAPLLVDYLAR